MANDKDQPKITHVSPASPHKGSGVAVDTPKWYIAECKPTKERTLRTMLQNANYDVCLLSRTETMVYKSRNRRQVEHIILGGRIFIRTEENQLMTILLEYPSIYRFLINKLASDTKQYKRVFSYVPDNEMARLQYLLRNAPNPVQVTTEELTLGQKVEVMRGPLAGFKGDFAKVGSSSCIVVKMEMGTKHYIYTEIALEDIQPILE